MRRRTHLTTLQTRLSNGRRERPLSFPPVLKTGLAVSGLALSPAPPRGAAPVHTLLDLLSAMRQFGGPHHF